jgi:hypothetical protein
LHQVGFSTNEGNGILLIVTKKIVIRSSVKQDHYDEHHENKIPFIIENKGAHGGVVVRHYATNRQVAGSIPDGVIGIFH